MLYLHDYCNSDDGVAAVEGDVMDSLKRNGEGYYDPTAYEAMKNILKGAKPMEIYRGDIFFVEGGTNNYEKGRPCVIVSNNTGNHFSNCVEVVWLTTAEKKPLPTHVEVIAGQKATAMCEGIETIRKERLSNFMRTCTPAEMQAIDGALMVSLGLDEGKCNTDENRAELECVKKEFDRLLKENELLRTAKPAFDEVTAELKQEVLKAQVERDTYKSLYESMLAKMIG